MTKKSPGPNSTKRALHHGQGLSVDFSFSGVKSKDKVVIRTLLVLMAKLVGYLSPITIQVCNMVRLVAAKHPQLSDYNNGCKSIALL